MKTVKMIGAVIAIAVAFLMFTAATGPRSVCGSGTCCCAPEKCCCAEHKCCKAACEGTCCSDGGCCCSDQARCEKKK